MDTKHTPNTVQEHLEQIRQEQGLRPQQLFIEGRTLTLQMVTLEDGAKGCEWTLERGDSMRDALAECSILLHRAKRAAIQLATK